MLVQVTQMMVNYLLDNLQPYLWAKRHEALHRFENFAFSLYPNFSSEMAIEILIGRAGTLIRIFTRSHEDSMLYHSVGEA